MSTQNGIPAIGDVLAVLDIIKNEQVYNERLRVIKEAQEELAVHKYIATTVEQANSILERAREKEQEYKDLIASSKETIEDLRKEKLKTVLEKEKKVLEKESKVLEKERELTNFEQETKSLKDLLETSIKEHRDLTEKLGVERVEISKIRNKLNEKYSKIRAIMAE